MCFDSRPLMGTIAQRPSRCKCNVQFGTLHAWLGVPKVDLCLDESYQVFFASCLAQLGHALSSTLNIKNQTLTCHSSVDKLERAHAVELILPTTPYSPVIRRANPFSFSSVRWVLQCQRAAKIRTTMVSGTATAHRTPKSGVGLTVQFSSSKDVANS